MEQYHNLLKYIIGNGDVSFEPRTQTYLLGVSGYQNTYSLNEGFPLVTTKNVPPRLPFEELFWKLRGERNVKSLVDKNVHIWTANAFDRYLKGSGLENKFPKHSLEWNEEFENYKNKISEDREFFKQGGDLGPVYGYQWRHWSGPKGEIDQLENLIKGLKENPNSRYHVLTAWNPGELNQMALGPCPFWHQFTVHGRNLDLHIVQRSCDTYLGVPFNIAQDALLLKMVSQETNLIPRNFIHTLINAHIYLGVEPRAFFWNNPKNVNEFQGKFREIKDREEYLELKKWYLTTSPEEGDGNKRKDHIPFVLDQLSKKPKKLPSVDLLKVSLFEMIKYPVGETVFVEGYEPHRWDAKAEMVA